MTLGEIPVRLSLTSFLYLLTSHLLLQAISGLSLLHGPNIDDGQEPSFNVSLIQMDVKQLLILSLHTQLLAKRYRLGRLDRAEQQRVSKEVCYCLFPNPSSAKWHVSQMMDALLRQQAATPIAYDHPHLTPVSTLGLTSMPPCPGWKTEDTLDGVKRPALSHWLIWVEISFPPRLCLGILDLLLRR